MYRTRSIVAGLLPLLPPGATPERLAVWLARGCLNQPVGAKIRAAALVGSQRSYSAAPPPPPAAAEPFLNGSSSVYVEDMYNSWLQDPKSVHAVSVTNSPIIGFQNISRSNDGSKRSRLATWMAYLYFGTPGPVRCDPLWTGSNCTRLFTFNARHPAL